MKTVAIAVFSSVLVLTAGAARAQTSSTTPETLQKNVQSLSDRVESFDRALKEVQKKLSNNYVGKTKIENVDNIDGLIMLLQETEQRVQDITGDVETLRFEQENLKKTLATVKADQALRLKEVEEKNKALETRLGVIESAITKAKEEKEKAEQAKATAEKKRKAESAAKEKAEKQYKEKLQADFGKKTPKELYDEALAQLNKKEYAPAQDKFRAFLELYPKDALAGNAQYWLGESYYAQAQYDKAAVAFADGYRNYENSAKAPDLLFKLGLTLAKQKKKDEACIAFDSFEKAYPKMSEAMKKQIASETKKLSCK